MNKNKIKEILDSVSNGSLSADDALLRLKADAYEDLGYAKIDHQRGIRQGASEVIYGEGKTAEQIAEIAKAMLDSGESSLLITRLSSDSADFVSSKIELHYFDEAQIGIAGENIKKSTLGNIVVATGGTSDIPVAEEAALTAEFYGNRVTRLYDVGVSGIHRLLDNSSLLLEAKVVVAVAGMEGALPSVIGGLVDCPVIAVPTSVGYGASFNGIAALLSMLNSCASGVTVVNIDNGFGAGYTASMINKI